MATKKMPLAALQAPCAYKRNKYRNLAIEYYARNSSFVLALTHERWPQGAWFSFAELAQLFSKEFGWEVDAHSLRRQLRRVKPNHLLFIVLVRGCELTMVCCLGGVPRPLFFRKIASTLAYMQKNVYLCTQF